MAALRRLLRRVSLLAALSALGAGAAPAAVEAQWSPASVLSECAADVAPQVAFPSDKPTRATGPGAIVWSAGAGCPGGAGARVAEIGTGDVPRPSLEPRTRRGAPISLRGALTVSPAPHGTVAIAGGAAGEGSGGMLIEGVAGGPFTALTTGEATDAPLALTTAYQGDLALASGDDATGALSVHVQRHFAAGFDRSAAAGRSGDGGRETARALSVAMDFRSDALAVWTAGGALYAHDLPAAGAKHPVERIATVGAHATIAALLSDDNRGIIAWAEQSGNETSVYLDQSATGVRFGTPKLIESFSDPAGITPPPASPRLVRLSSESVMFAWAGVSDGAWVVRTAAIDQQGLQTITTIATAGTNALLSDLAPGPLGEALVAWTEPTEGATGRSIFTARGTESAPGRTFFGEPEALGPAGASADPLVAFDPDSDRAIAVWHGPGARIEYAIRAAGATP